jgi:hypothetical protein
MSPHKFDREHIFVFFRKIKVFRLFGFYGLFRNSLFRLFRFYTEIESFDVSVEPKQTEDQPKQFESGFGLFRFVSKQFCLFQLFETPKQTNIFLFWSHETNRNTTEKDLVSVCFGSNHIFVLF